MCLCSMGAEEGALCLLGVSQRHSWRPAQPLLVASETVDRRAFLLGFGKSRLPRCCRSQTAGWGPKPGSRVSIYSAERARFELAKGLSRCRCPPLCRPAVSANASSAVAKLISAGTGPRLRRVAVGLPGDALSPSRPKRPDVRVGAQGRRLPFRVEAIVVSCLPPKLSVDRKFPYDVLALALEARTSD